MLKDMAMLLKSDGCFDTDEENECVVHWARWKFGFGTPA